MLISRLFLLVKLFIWKYCQTETSGTDPRKKMNPAMKRPAFFNYLECCFMTLNLYAGPAGSCPFFKWASVLILLIQFSFPSIINARSAPVVASITTHFAELPKIILPCGDLELVYHTKYADHIQREDLFTLQALRRKHMDLLKEIEPMRVELTKSLENFLLAGYAYYRAKTLGGSETILAEKKFSYANYVWYWHLVKIMTQESLIRSTAKSYYDITSLYNSALDEKDQAALIEKFSARLKCLNENRQKAFAGIFRTHRYSYQDILDMAGDKPVSIEKASEYASSAANWSGYIREHGWMAAEASIATQILRQLLLSRERYVYSRHLHPALMEVQKQYGPAVGPSERFPKDADVQRARIEIARIRAKTALNYLYLTPIPAEDAFMAQLNLSTGVTGGLISLGASGADAAKKIFNTPAVLDYDSWTAWLGKNEINAGLSILSAGVEFAASAFSTMTASIADSMIKFLPAETDIKTSVEKALDAYEKKMTAINQSIRVLETLEKEFDPAHPHAFAQGQALSRFIVTGEPSGSRVAVQAPGTVGQLLEDPGFIEGTGGGLAWILEPVCENLTQITSLMMHTARLSLTANARDALQRIFLSRGIPIPAELMDRPLSRETIDAISHHHDVAPEDSNIIYQSFIDYGRDLIHYVGDSQWGRNKAAGLSALKESWAAAKTYWDYEASNVPDQDGYLNRLLAMQLYFDKLLSGLADSGYSFSTLAGKHPDVYQLHLALQLDCPEYINALLNIRNVHQERVKLFNAVQQSESDTTQLSGKGKVRLISLDKDFEISSTNLAARMAFLKTEHHALSINYLGAAQELKNLEILENMRRAAQGIEDRVDLSDHVQKFIREARLSELNAFTQKMAKDITYAYVTAGVGRFIALNTLAKPGYTFYLNQTIPNGMAAFILDKKTLGELVLGTLNPWYGTFSANGMRAVVQGAASDTAISAMSHTITAALGHDDQWEGSLNQYLSYTRDIGSQLMSPELPETVAAPAGKESISALSVPPTIEQQAFSRDVLERLNRVTDVEQKVITKMDRNNADLEAMLHAVAQKDWDQVDILRKKTLGEARKAAVDKDVLHYQRLMDGLRDIMDLEMDLKVAAKNDIESHQAAEIAKTAIRSRLSDTKNRSEKNMKAAARIFALADLKQKMNSEVPDVSDLRQLVDTDSSNGAYDHLLQEEFDIYLIREGLSKTKNSLTAKLKAAGDSAEKQAFETSLKEVDAIAAKIDEKRIKLIETGLARFLEEYPQRDKIRVIMQGGAAEGNPEYQGIFGDIDFTVMTNDGADGVQIKKDLEKFFRDNGYPMATKESKGYSPMDTEAFIQPAGRFDSAGESIADIIKDVTIKMNDPTRFYSEAGGKWFINNVLYSGKKLWGKMEGLGPWVRVQKGEAYGLGVDMVRYMDFLTNPKYESKAIAAMQDPAARKKVLESVLKKTKYFIRLIDAYVISHDKGNELYHERLSQKNKSRQDASYHWQIFKDVRTLIENGHPTLLNQPGDLDMIRDMALMKMKGDHPSPFDVIGHGPDGIEKGIKMVARMEQLLPEMMARMAQIHHDETMAVSRNGSDGERRSAAADQMRQASIAKARHLRDTLGSEAMMVPKLLKGALLSETVHSKEIAKRMEGTRQLRVLSQRYEHQRDSLVKAQPLEDPTGITTRLTISKVVREAFDSTAQTYRPSDAAIQNLIQDESNAEAHHFLLAAELLKGVGSRPKKGVK